MSTEVGLRYGLKVLFMAALFAAAPACVSEPRPSLAATEGGKTDKPQQGTVYTCPMHPEVISDKPGRCPKCGMKLVPKEPAAPGGKK